VPQELKTTGPATALTRNLLRWGRERPQTPASFGSRWARGALAAAMLAACACDAGPGKPDKSPPPPVTGARAPEAPGSAAMPSLSASASAAAAAPANKLAGTWVGTYESKKGSVALPDKVKDKERDADPGTVAVGKGEVTLTIAPDGDVKGKWSGALGKVTLTGKLDGNVVRVSALPDDYAAADAMTGVLIGMAEGDKIRAEIRVAGRDANIVREAAFEMKRQ
jgi:hypothetical protein